MPDEVGPEWAILIPQPMSPSNSTSEAGRVHRGLGRHGTFEDGIKESKVADPEKFSGKKGNEVYCWFVQLQLVFQGKPQTYHSDAHKVAFALSYMVGAAQNWAMPLLQAFDEGREHELLENYDAFREAVIGVYGDLDRRGNSKDRLAQLRQMGSMATYISSFNEYAAQIDWNKSSLVVRFRGGLKDEILDSVATTQTQSLRLHEWMAMASCIDERLWGQRQTRRSSTDSSNVKILAFSFRDSVGRFQSNSATSGPVPMELEAI